MGIRTSNPGRRSGIDDLVDHRARPRPPALFQADEACWCRYAYKYRLRLFEMVLAHSRVDAASLGLDGFRDWKDECIRRRNPVTWPHLKQRRRETPPMPV